MTDHPAADRVEEALSVEEERRVRNEHHMGEYIDGCVCGDPDCDLIRLLATLDAVRSTAPATGPGLDWDLALEPLTAALAAALRAEVPDLDIEDEDVVMAQAEAILARLRSPALRAATEAPERGPITMDEIGHDGSDTPVSGFGTVAATEARPGDPWPSRDEFSRMTATEINAFFASIGVAQRVVDEPLARSGVDEVGEPVKEHRWDHDGEHMWWLDGCPEPVDERRLTEALEPFARAAANEASRPHLEDGYFIGPSGLTVADWRRLRAALASTGQERRDG